MALLKSAVEKRHSRSHGLIHEINETVAHEFVNDAREVAFSKKDWQDFVDRYGHLRPGTYDITRSIRR